MEIEKTYKSFDELFEDAILWGAIPLGECEGKNPKEIEVSKAIFKQIHEGAFLNYLRVNKGIEIENEQSYCKEFTKENFLNFLRDNAERENEIRARVEKEKESWQVANKLPKQFNLSIDIISFDKGKHKLNFQMGFVPENVMTYYMERNKFIYIDTATAKCIPVLHGSYELLCFSHKDNKRLADEFLMVFDCYAIGFLKGFETTFTPFISTPENIKELILKAININMAHGFTTTYKNQGKKALANENAYYEANAFYEMGEEVGRNYRAWLLVLETPSYFQNEFPFTIAPLAKPEPPSEINNIIQTAPPLQQLKDRTKEELHSYFIDLEYFRDNKNLQHFKGIDSFTFSRKEYPFKIPVYSPYLMLILNSRQIPAWNSDENINETFNGRNYVGVYCQAFAEGVKYFEDNFALTPDTLYGANAKTYIRTLHTNYFHSGCEGGHKGWVHAKNDFWEIVNKTIIKEYGFDSGIVSKVDELKIKHPLLFKDFEVCSHEQIAEDPYTEDGKNANKPTLVSSKSVGKTQRKKLPSTEVKYKEYLATYNRFTRNKKYSHNKAEKATCEKHRISPKTLERAIRNT